MKPGRMAEPQRNEIAETRGEEHTLSNMQSMPSKRRPLPHQSPLLGQQPRHLPAHQFIPHRLLRVRVHAIFIHHVPRAAGVAVVVGDGGFDRLVAGFFGVKGVAVVVFGAPDGAGAGGRVDLVDCVCGAVDVGVEAEAEEVCEFFGVSLCFGYWSAILCFVKGRVVYSRWWLCALTPRYTSVPQPFKSSPGLHAYVFKMPVSLISS